MLLAGLCGSKELATAVAHHSTGMSDGSGLPSTTKQECLA